MFKILSVFLAIIMAAVACSNNTENNENNYPASPL